MNQPQRGAAHIAEVAENIEHTSGAKDLEGEDLSQAERAMILRIGAASWTEVARLLNYESVYAARRAVEAYISTINPTEEEVDHQRYLHSRRLERLLNSVMPTAVRTSSPDHLAYNARALAILDRIASLQGLNAPAQQIVYTPRSEEIERYVAHFSVLAQADTKAIEADVLDADAE